MKIKNLLLSLTFIITISCDSIEEHRMINESTLNKVLKDPLSKKFNQALLKTLESSSFFIGNQNNFESSRINGFESIEDLKSFIQANYSNPDLVYKSLFEFVEIGWEIRNKYPEVSKFTADELGILVKEVSEMRNSFNQHNPYPRFRIQGQCEDEQASAIQTCGDAALIGAAACGLLTPTLGGAFLCGGFVYLTELACIDDANRSYEICKKYEN